MNPTMMRPQSWWTTSIQVARDNLEVSLQSLRSKGTVSEAGAHKIAQALKYAEHWHGGQTRADKTTPYLIHLLRVTTLLIKCGEGDPNVLCAGLLHDILEDTDCAEGAIDTEFGGDARKIVVALTRGANDERPKGGERADSAYLARSRASGEGAVKVKLADKIDNLRDQHPVEAKRRMFLNETLTAYVPMLADVKDAPMRRALGRELLEAVCACAVPGEAIPASDSAALESALHEFLLLNPGQRFWITCDGSQAVVTQPEPDQLFANVIATLRRLRREGRLASLAFMAGVPADEARVWSGAGWARIDRQLAALSSMTWPGAAPVWLESLLTWEAMPFALLLVQALLYRPASYTRPQWVADHGAELTRESPARALLDVTADDKAQADHWQAARAMVLEERQALWRFATGRGTAARMMQACIGIPRGTAARALWAVRFTAEHIGALSDVVEKSGGNVHERDALLEVFANLWQDFEKTDFDPGMVAKTHAAPSVERKGMLQAGAKFEGEPRLAGQWKRLEALLVAEAAKHGDRAVWIEFDREEWRKRWPEVAAYWRPLHDASCLADLEMHGARIIENTTDRAHVLRVVPSRVLTLRNRVPEITEDSITAIRDFRFSACAIFDELLLKPLAHGTSGTLFLPRAYRILDSMEALDPPASQRITLLLENSDTPRVVESWLPLPRTDDERTMQEERKRIVACHLAVQAYNSGVVWRVLRVACACTPDKCTDAFTREGLHRLIEQEAARLGLPQSPNCLVAGNFNYVPFGVVKQKTAAEASFVFDADRMRSGGWRLGIDIGGTAVKVALFKGAKLTPLKETATQKEDFMRFETLHSGEGVGKDDRRVEAAEFCRRIIARIGPALNAGGLSWSELEAIGVSWPGAVRESRIVASSRVLGSLTEDGNRFSEDTHPLRIHTFDLLGHLRAAITQSGVQLDERCTMVLENDGNAEAFGNFCLQVMEGRARVGRDEAGTIIIKLGTSTAGSRITGLGTVADEVGEFGRPFLDLAAAARRETDPGRIKAAVAAAAMRKYVSSEAVRDLTRTHFLNGRPVFGAASGWNSESAKGTRVESAHAGRMLPLWFGAGSEKELLEEMVRTDAMSCGGDVIQRLAATLRPGGAQHAGFVSYTLGLAGRIPETESAAQHWQRAVARLMLLVTGMESDTSNLGEKEFPSGLDYDEVAFKITGAAAIFSRLGLQIAHAIALLYNIYPKRSFDCVILAGGVLAQQTGRLVIDQTTAFLRKYYDKLIALTPGEQPPKPLPYDAVRLADPAGFEPEAIGPLGAALVAARQHALDSASAVIP